MDRLITISMGHHDRTTEIAITVAQSGIPQADAETIVDVVRELRGIGVNNHRPTIRACIAIGRILARMQSRARWDEVVFRMVCQDVLSTDTAKVTRGGESLMPQKVHEIIRKVCAQRNKRHATRAVAV